MRLDTWTLVLQAINFLVLVVLLQRFLYRPVTRAIARRKEQTEKVLADVAAAKAAADSEQARLAAENAKLLGVRDKLLEDARAEIEVERQRAIEAARAEAAAVHANTRERLLVEEAEVRTGLRRHAVELAIELSSSILRASASPVVTEALLDQLTERLAALPADELGGLRDQAASGRGLEVVTAPALPPGAEAQLRERLVDRLGAGAHIAFASDDQLIAGVELRFPSTVISISWRDALQRAREELVRDVAA